MPYNKTTWVQGVTPANATNMNNLETQYDQATKSFPAGFFTAFVVLGLIATKDGTIANLLDVTSGTAWLTQSDGTLHQQQIAAFTETTAALNATYYLYVQPDGTIYWSTTNAPATNSLAIAQVTTDASGNILAVTDERVTDTTVFIGQIGSFVIPSSLKFGAGGQIDYESTFLMSRTKETGGVAQAHGFQTWNGSASKNPFGIGSAAAGTFTSYVGDNGALNLGGQASAGSFGAPVIVAQALNTHVTVTTQQTILSYTPTVTGLYRINCGFFIHNTGTIKPSVGFSYTGGNDGVVDPVFMALGGGTVMNGSNQVFPNTGGTDFNVNTQTVTCAAGAAITCTFTDNVGTPDDHCTFIIERLS